MLHPSVDELLTKIDSKYRLVHVIAKRTHQIENDDYTQIDDYVSAKSIGIALEEFNENLINIE